MVEKKKTESYAWQIFLAEFIGTALLLLVALSIVIFMFGTGSPILHLLPDIGVRRLITGFLFGSTGALISMSRIGKVSGAHLNPVVTFAFLLMRKINIRTAWRYVSGQLTGAIFGCLPLLAWGPMGRSVEFGATMPGVGYSLQIVLLGEIMTTFTMLCLLAVFLASRRLRPLHRRCFPFFIPLWFTWKVLFPERAQILHAAWVLQSFRVIGRDGGSIGSARLPVHCWQFSLFVFL